MNSIRSKVFLLALICLFGLLECKPNRSTANKFKTHVRYLLNQVGTENEYTKFLSFLKLNSPENVELKKVYDDLFSFDAYLSDMSEIYAKYFTVDDVINLIRFYSTSLGKKTLQLNHDIHRQMEDIMYNKISEYIFTSSEYGYDIPLPEFAF